jgi:hypothetical protein
MYLASISSFLKRYASSSPSLIRLPPYSGNNTLSPTLTDTGTSVPSLVVKPGPTASTSPSLGLACPDSGRRIPDAVYAIYVVGIIIIIHEYNNAYHNHAIPLSEARSS